MSETVIYALLLCADLFVGGFFLGWERASKRNKETPDA